MNYDVIIVGAGITGVAVAERLADSGLACVILEAGPVAGDELPGDRARFLSEIGPHLHIDDEDWDYRTDGVEQDWLRVRAGGGRTLMWGGWSLPPIEQNFRDADSFERPWPVGFDELQPYLRKARDFLDVRSGELYPAYEAITERLDFEVRPKQAAVEADARRAATALDRLNDVPVIANAVVTQVLRTDDGSAEGVEYLDGDTGEAEEMYADTVVLCASPVETARIVMMSGDGDDEIGGGMVGLGLVNHMVASYLVVVPEPAPDPPVPTVLDRAVFMPRFVNLDDETQRDYRGGFTLELRGPIAMTALEKYVLDAIDIDFDRVEGMSYYLVHALGEVGPDPERYVELDFQSTDGLGRPIPVLHWTWREEQQHMARDMRAAAEAVATVLATSDSRIIPFRDPLAPGAIPHEAGTCAMGTSPDHSVVDPGGEVWDAPGLYIADASVMPTAFDRPPTLTLLALALHAADGIIERRT